MIKLGIIGLGNVAQSVHLPVLKSRNDVQLVWICDKQKLVKDISNKISIPYYFDLNDALNSECPDIVLITTPYNTRADIFKILKDKVKGIYCEKPFALSTKEHLDYFNGYENYAFTIGYQRRSLGNVQILKNLVQTNLFGQVKKILIEFGDIHYSFDNFRAQKSIAGGGILFESGSHWIDTVLFFSNAVDLNNFSSEIKYEDGLDVYGEGVFNIQKFKNETINCEFKFSSINNTSNKITVIFENMTIDLYLYDNNSNLIVKNKDSRKFILNDFNMGNYPNDSISQSASYWQNFLTCFKEKKQSYSTNETLFLTSKFIELYYAK